MKTFRALLNLTYAWIAQGFEGGAEALDKALGASQDAEPARRRGPDPNVAALMAAFRLPQDA